jgi:hypothetical protein
MVKGSGQLFNLFRNYCTPNPENNITYTVFLLSVAKVWLRAKPPLLACMRRKKQSTFF